MLRPVLPFVISAEPVAPFVISSESVLFLVISTEAEPSGDEQPSGLFVSVSTGERHISIMVCSVFSVLFLAG